MLGFDEKKLLELCDEKYIHNGYSEWVYWTSEIYSFGKYIRDYGFYPFFLPLYIYTDHGVAYLSDRPFKHELDSNSYCQFYHSPESVKNWKKYSNKPCFTLYSPFVFYRKKNKVTQMENASGTLAFPAHSTKSIEDLSNIEEYIMQLKKLPAEFQPVSVCLHCSDIINKNLHKTFIDNDIPVYTADHVCDYRFAQRFYNILKNFKYTTSNMIGSYTFYSVEMGIPFSLYGQEPDLYNNSDDNIEKGSFNEYKNSIQHINMYNLFNGLHKNINIEQKTLIEKDLGINDGLSRLKLSKILYAALFKKIKFQHLIYPIIKYSKKPRVFFKQLKYELENYVKYPYK